MEFLLLEPDVKHFHLIYPHFTGAHQVESHAQLTQPIFG